MMGAIVVVAVVVVAPEPGALTATLKTEWDAAGDWYTAGGW